MHGLALSRKTTMTAPIARAVVTVDPARTNPAEIMRLVSAANAGEPGPVVVQLGAE